MEVQIFGDGKGTVLALGERDCSAQRRNQKVLEETPAPGLSAALRKALHEAAVKLGESVAYQSAGTVEFVLDAEAAKAQAKAAAPIPSGFYFLEVNTRLQVEHGVTEEVTGIDLVEWMIRQAAGELGDLSALRPASLGCSIQARVYAENPRLEFRPSAGLLTEAVFPAETRVDTWVERGSEVSPFYDPLLAKVIVKGKDRAEALAALSQALAGTRLDGIETNLEFLRAVAASPVFAQGDMTTRWLVRIRVPIGFGRCARPRRPDHGPGLSGPHRLLGRGRAALRAFRPSFLPPGQPLVGQPRGRRRPGNHHRGPHPALQPRLPRGPDRSGRKGGDRRPRG